MKKPLLSIIVPVYNMEAFLQRCIDSILNQTYKNFELILVDDGSTDNSSFICDTYVAKDDRVSVIHIKNSGIFQARKRGVEKARGDIVTFSDADDWLEYNAFEFAIQFMKYNVDIFSYAYTFDNNIIEKHLYNEQLYSKPDIENEIISGMMYDSTISTRRLNPSLCCKYIKRDLFLKVANFIEDRITFGEDALITYPAVCMAEKIYISNKALYHYTHNDFSCTHIFTLERITEIQAFQNNIVQVFNEIGELNRLKYQIDSYIRTFLQMFIKNWYNLELSSISFSFPFDIIPKDSKIIIYGAGNVGKSYINELRIKKFVNVVGWADKKYKEVNIYNNIDIIAPELIVTKEFEFLLIAVWDEKVAYNIKSELVQMGINKNKIIWKQPIHIL